MRAREAAGILLALAAGLLAAAVSFVAAFLWVIPGQPDDLPPFPTLAWYTFFTSAGYALALALIRRRRVDWPRLALIWIAVTLVAWVVLSALESWLDLDTAVGAGLLAYLGFGFFVVRDRVLRAPETSPQPPPERRS